MYGNNLILFRMLHTDITERFHREALVITRAMNKSIKKYKINNVNLLLNNFMIHKSFDCMAS